MSKRKHTEYAINMTLEKMMLVQQKELGLVPSYEYFTEDTQCHIYFVCKRSRISLDIINVRVDRDYIDLPFCVQKQNKIEKIDLKIKNTTNNDKLKVLCEYPYNYFQFTLDNETIFQAKSSVFVQEVLRNEDNIHLDLEILYIGQSYGNEGERTAIERLKNHSTLQSIYSDAILNNPDCEIWLALAYFEEMGILFVDGLGEYSDTEKNDMPQRFLGFYNKFTKQPLNQQQKINFTEAALIKHFQPKYNIVYKNSFPDASHKSYEECYKLDVNSVCFEMDTHDMIGCCFYSETIKRNQTHLAHFLMHSESERKSIFEYP